LGQLLVDPSKAWGLLKQPDKQKPTTPFRGFGNVKLSR